MKSWLISFICVTCNLWTQAMKRVMKMCRRETVTEDEDGRKEMELRYCIRLTCNLWTQAAVQRVIKMCKRERVNACNPKSFVSEFTHAMKADLIRLFFTHFFYSFAFWWSTVKLDVTDWLIDCWQSQIFSFNSTKLFNLLSVTCAFFCFLVCCCWPVVTSAFYSYSLWKNIEVVLAHWLILTPSLLII